MLRIGVFDAKNGGRRPPMPPLPGEGEDRSCGDAVRPNKQSCPALHKSLAPGPAPAQGVTGLPDEGRDADLEQERGGIERLVFTCVSLAGLRSGGTAVHSTSKTRVKRADGRERTS